MQQLIDFTSSGLYCPVADIYIDPWKPVDKAIITHAHADHARIGNMMYLAHKDSIPLLKHRLGMYINAQALEYGECVNINGVKISLHPAGHIIGSAQVRLEYKGEVWVVSGDYKLDNDGICSPFEPVKCDVFVTESIYGLPIFKWEAQHKIYDDMNRWWAENISRNMVSILIGYPLGKAQRIISNIDLSIGEVYAHSSIENINQVLRANGTFIPKVKMIDPTVDPTQLKRALILAPPSSLNTPWIEKFSPSSVAFASGWMSLRNARRKRNLDMGFALSDHADWNQLRKAVLESGARTVYLTHGYSSSFSRWLSECNIEVKEVSTKFHGEIDEISHSIIHDIN